MSSEKFAIRVKNLSKCYEIYENPRDRLKQFMLPRIQHLLGKKTRQYFQEFWALKNVAIDVKKGETIGIIGRNGAGKSTLLQILCGTLAPTSGSVEINGRVAALLELGAGFNAEFTGTENIFMNASVLGLNKEEIDARFDDIVSFADIGDFINQPVKTYSSGMYVRLAFAVIAHVNADILIIDEALAVGDAFFTQKCMRFLRGFMETGTVIFVSHDTGALVNLCSHALLLENGDVKLAGSPKEVSEQYLADQYQSIQGDIKTPAKKVTSGPSLDSQDFHDMRRDFVNKTSLRNDIEVFKYCLDDSGFGKGGANICLVRLLDQDNKPLAWTVGGETVQLIINCKANTILTAPIVGFFVKDKLGQMLFGDNTFIAYCQNPLTVLSGQSFTANFIFRMPILPSGDYSITVAIAEGTQQEHIQHHWIHDALILKSHSSSVCTGLLGVPMSNIKMEVT